MKSIFDTSYEDYIEPETVEEAKEEATCYLTLEEAKKLKIKMLEERPKDLVFYKESLIAFPDKKHYDKLESLYKMYTNLSTKLKSGEKLADFNSFKRALIKDQEEKSVIINDDFEEEKEKVISLNIDDGDK